MQADNNGALKQHVQFDLFDTQVLRALNRQERIVGNDPHLRALRPIGDDGADSAAIVEALFRQLTHLVGYENVNDQSLLSP